MKKLEFRTDEFSEFRLNPKTMNKLRGGDVPTPPVEPPVLLPPK